LALNPSIWHGSALGTECTFHQLAPYIGKMKSTMAKELIVSYSKTGDLVLDPFAGSGAIALESLIARRSVICTDINPYAITLTNAKIMAPQSAEDASKKADELLDQASKVTRHSIEGTPAWVKQFFHPQTLQEIINFSKIVRDNDDFFLMACLLGILHHQRPGFLSYPSSHLVPYLRTQKFPKGQFPELYTYRPLRIRLMKKIERVYKRPVRIDASLLKKCQRADIRSFKGLNSGCIDAIITSPPYMDALDYARDNRLRLWFLGIQDYKSLDTGFRSLNTFSSLMTSFLVNASNWLKEDGYCVCVVGEVSRKNTSIDIARIIAKIAIEKVGKFKVESIVTDDIPDIRRSRKGSYVKTESIVCLTRKRN
jgi:methylase of polypeptide subunit release factors